MRMQGEAKQHQAQDPLPGQFHISGTYPFSQALGIMGDILIPSKHRRHLFRESLSNYIWQQATHL